MKTWSIITREEKYFVECETALEAAQIAQENNIAVYSIELASDQPVLRHK